MFLIRISKVTIKEFTATLFSLDKSQSIEQTFSWCAVERLESGYEVIAGPLFGNGFRLIVIRIIATSKNTFSS